MEKESTANKSFSQDVLNEIESLSAIYENEVTFTMLTDQLIELNYKSSTAELEIEIDVNYPDKSPCVKVKSVDVISPKELNFKLEQYVSLFVGNQCLYNIISKAAEYSNHNKNLDDSDVKERSICRFFLKGNCKFADKCFNLHCDARGTIKKTELKTVSDNECRSSLKAPQKKFKALRKSTSTRIDDECKNMKKVSMRTAIDVIQRILWDDALPTNDFFVGYLDRFIGIQEKRFTDFSWEDIATVDYNVLAIPKHRIQYFKYKHEKVWDKNERLDKMFGSTGDTELIMDIICEHNKLLDKTSHTQQRTTVPEEKLEDKVHFVKTLSDQNRPNFFLCLRLTDHELVANIKKVQQHILTFDERLHEAMIPPNCLHLTLCMMRLVSVSDKRKACDVLRKIEPLLNWMLSVNTEPLRFSGVDNFRGMVLYLKTEHHIPFMKLQSFVMSKFRDAGLNLCGNYDVYTPHVTLMKFSRPLSKRLNIKSVSQHYYENFKYFPFGSQHVSGLRLCLTGTERGSDQFYVTISRIQNSLMTVSPKIGKLVYRNFKNLVDDNNFVSPEQVANKHLRNLEQTLDAVSFEKTVQKLLRCLTLSKHEKKKFFFLLRGLPGSGKSYVAEKLLKNNDNTNSGTTVRICSADDYFQSKPNEYTFSGEEVLYAHQYCCDQVLTAIHNDVDYIVIDNTFSNKWEYDIYERLALLCGYSIFIFQIPCDSFTIQEQFFRRCKHRVTPGSHKKMYELWQDDLQCIPLIIECDKNFSIHDLLELRNNFRTQLRPSSILYAAMYLDEASKRKLVTKYPSKLQKHYCDHVTLIFQPSMTDLNNLPIGRIMNVSVERYFENSHLQLVSVREINTKICQLQHPHVTISTSESSRPQQAHLFLENQSNNRNGNNYPISEFVLSGTMGVQVAYTPSSSWKCTNQDDFNKLFSVAVSTTDSDVDNVILQNDSLDSIFIDECTQSSEVVLLSPNDEVDISIYNGRMDMVTSLFIFDFDGTLFHTPGPQDGRRDYHKITGYHWPHRGWIRRKESMLSPLLIHPGPSLDEYYAHCNRANSKCILLTGRPEKTRQGVEAVLKEYGMTFAKIILKPDVTVDASLKRVKYSESDVYTYKKKTVDSLLQEYNDTKIVKFWDDRADNISAIGDLRAIFPHIDFQLFRVDEVMPDMYKFEPIDFFKKLGIRRSMCEERAIGEAMLFIRSTWYDLIKKDVPYVKELTMGELDSCMIFFGSYQLHRKGDVDVCLLVPANHRVESYINKLAEQFLANGMIYCHYASNIRCPRIKLRFHFENTAPIEVDIVLACVIPPTLDAMKAMLRQPIDIQTLIKTCTDSKSKIALNGPHFLREILKKVEGVISLHDFGILVDLVSFILKANKLKGNLFHCIRTFHVVHTLALFVENHLSSSDYLMTGIETMKEYEKIVKSFFHYCATLEDSFWKTLFQKFVPDFYIPLLKSFFQSSESISLDRLLLTAPSLTKNLNFVKVTVLSTNMVSIWKAMILLEVKVGSSLRELIDEGVEIKPGDITENSISFHSNNVMECKRKLEHLKSDVEKSIHGGVKVNIIYHYN